MKTCTTLTILFVFSILSFSQSSLYIPRNVLNAYEKGTRSFSGTPGENYWQNSAEYKIKVFVEPETRLVRGTEQIEYFNNSPDTLKVIVINLIQNMNKPGSERNIPLPEESLTDGVVIEKFLINDLPVIMEDVRKVSIRSTLLRINIEDDPLPPGSKMNLEIDWNFTIPGGSNPRMGAYDSTSFFIAYWYPQIAVYDDIDGWDILHHTGEQEFYNDFSDYEVEITVPNNFGVWSTGTLQNPEEVLEDEYLIRYNKARNSDNIINIVTKDEVNSGKIYKSSSSVNTWKYKADYVTDFAFGISDHYLWDAVSFVADKQKGDRVYIAAVYKEESKDFYEVSEIARKCISYFSNELPGIPYPFPSLTVFNGSGGMEFPMIVNDGSAKRRSGTVSVTSHEIAHQYFPFFIGTNEEKYGWMDEGMAVFLPFNFQEREGKYNPRGLNVKIYEFNAGREMELPPMIPSYQMRGPFLRLAIYVRPALAYNFLYDALGKELFDKCMHEYIRRWNGKHPIPADFFFTFNDVSGKDLNWYWKPWFFESGYPDLRIAEADFIDGKLKIVIDKIGNIPTPVLLTLNFDGGLTTEIYKTAFVWENKNRIVIEKELDTKPISIILGNDRIPDSNKDNNYHNFSESTY
ncbi:MAG: M1 family peptidase [Ignavibacteriales bacterium]|nr:MAG: M1 family peptidase [Ignavibacteriales bacterium]